MGGMGGIVGWWVWREGRWKDQFFCCCFWLSGDGVVCLVVFLVVRLVSYLVYPFGLFVWLDWLFDFFRLFVSSNRSFIGFPGVV